jgi:hypothetical protein
MTANWRSGLKSGPQDQVVYVPFILNVAIQARRLCLAMLSIQGMNRGMPERHLSLAEKHLALGARNLAR